MARREAWDALPSSPNEYYHSFLPPGEKPAAGADWSAKELNNFELLLAEHPEKVASGKWGLLSIHHPGRTGAQCQARYERLVREGPEEAGGGGSSSSAAKGAAGGAAAKKSK